MQIFFSISILAAAAFLLFFLFVYLIFSNGRRCWFLWNCNTNLPPSPPSLPILGHCHLLKLPTHRSLAALAQAYGPILHLQFGSRPVLLVSSSSAAQECFSKNDIILSNRPRFTVGKYIGYDYTVMLFASYGPHWRNLRRISTIEILSQHRIKMAAATQKAEIQSLAKCLFEDYYYYSGGEGGKLVELKSRFLEIMFNVILGMITGKQYHGESTVNLEEERRFRNLIQEVTMLLDVSNYADFFPFLGWIDFGGIKKRMAKVRCDLDESLQRLIDKHGRRLNKEEEESGKTLINVLLSLKQTEADYYTDDIIKGLILVL